MRAKRSQELTFISDFCPAHLTACALGSGGYECVDMNEELESE